jgi:hypothetical protein
LSWWQEFFENLGTRNQAIKPKLASFRQNAVSQSGFFPNWLRFAKKVISQSGLSPDWLRFANWCLTVTQPDWLRFAKKVISQSWLLPGLASFRQLVPGPSPRQIGFVSQKRRPVSPASTRRFLSASTRRGSPVTCGGLATRP